MKEINLDDLLDFSGFQHQLYEAFSRLYPDALDYKFLLDFPKDGIIEINGEKWNFVRHGTGLKFFRLGSEPNLVVDMHKFFNQPKMIDKWRLQQFFESCSRPISDEQISELFFMLSSKGFLLDKGNGQYLLL